MTPAPVMAFDHQVGQRIPSAPVRRVRDGGPTPGREERRRGGALGSSLVYRTGAVVEVFVGNQRM